MQRTIHLQGQAGFNLISASLILLTGILVGLRANVVVLFSLTFALVSVCAITGLIAGDPGILTLRELFVAWICLQCGYMIGLTGRIYVDQLISRFNGIQSKRI